MPALHKNRVKMTVSGTPGTGTVTLNAASSGHQSFATAYGANATVDVLFEDGTAWEVARNCTYTHSGTTVTRGTLEESSTGSAISLTSAATASVIATAGNGNLIEALLQGVTPGGRLTLESGVPVSTTDQTAKTSVYFTPYVHNMIVLWDGADWCPTTFTEKTLALGTLTSGKPYDVFGYLSSGALVLESLAWTNDTTRATAVTLQDGRYCKSGDKTRLYLGSFYTTSTTTTEDSAGGTTTQVGGKRFLWNMYNQVERHASVIDTAASWSYATATVRQANAATGNKIQFMCGLDSLINAQLQATVYLVANSLKAAYAGFGVDSTTTMSGVNVAGYNVASTGVYVSIGGAISNIFAAGYHYLAWVESGADGTTSIFVGSNGADTCQSGIVAQIQT